MPNHLDQTVCKSYFSHQSQLILSALKSPYILRYPILQTISLWSSLIRVHSVLFYVKISSELHLNICSRSKKTDNIFRTNYSGYWIILHPFLLSTDFFFQNQLFRKILSGNHQSAKQSGSRSGLTFCQA